MNLIVGRKILGFFILALFFIWAIFSGNPLETVIAGIALFVVYYLFFFLKPSPVIFLSLLTQWVAIYIKVIWANIDGINLKEVFSYYTSPENIHQAFYFSSFGFISISFGIFLFLQNEALKDRLVKDFSAYSFKHLFIFYIAFSVFIEIILSGRGLFPGLFQVFYSLSELKWGILTVIIIYAFAVERSRKKYAIGLALVEFSLGLYSYFSDFKTVIVYFIIGIAFILGDRIKAKHLVIGTFSLILLFQFGLLWTTIKGDYRAFLSQGQRAQKVSVSSEDAFDKFFELAANVNAEDLKQNEAFMIDRLGYLDFFSLVIEQVPEKVPFEEGKVWFSSFTHMVTPRILFPNKPSIDDSEHTRKYSGIMVATQSMGASHSLGYMVDAYIDFGPVFMVLPLFLFGAFIGLTYSNLLYKSYNLLWGILLSVPVYTFISTFGKNSLKMVSQLIMYLLVIWLFRKFVIPRIDHYIRKPN